jgi:DNA invertase Pin-like site-specific DNA recombinase
MPRVAIYTRVSTEDQAREGFSLGAQKERLIAYCEAQGWDITDLYQDEGHSGRNTRRPAYQRMIEERDRWDIMLVMKMDRIHRNSKNFMIMMETLEKWGKKFTSMNESLDTSNAVGRFVVDIIQRIAQLESEQIGERTYMGMSQKAETGMGLLGFNPPFGYTIQDGNLVAIGEEAVLVQDVFHAYLQGKTMERIAGDMNRNNNLTRRGLKWTVWSISHVLHNPIYAGYLRWDGKIIASSHAPIVTLDVYNTVQCSINERTKKKIHKNPISLSPKSVETT